MDNKNLLKTIESIKLELAKRKDGDRLKYYKIAPDGKPSWPASFHWSFLTTWVVEGKKINFFIGSNQSGKTTVVAVLLRGMMMGYHAWIKQYAKHIRDNWDNLKYPHSGFWFKNRKDVGQDTYECVKFNPIDEEYNYMNLESGQEAYDYIMGFENLPIRTPSRVAVVVKDFKVGVGEVFEPKLKELVPLPHKNGKYIRNIERMQGKIAERIIWTTDSESKFFSGEQDAFRFEGATWNAVIWDEPPKHEHYIGMRRGSLVLKSPHFFDLTPISEPWIFDTLLQDVNKPGGNVHLSTCDLYSPEVHWMTLEEKEDFEREIFRKDPHEVEARIHGKFTHLLGRVYPTYNEDVHLIPHSEVEKMMTQSVTFGITNDPHDRRPSAIAYWFVNANNDIYFFKNYPTEPMPDIKSCDLTIKNYADMFKKVQAEFCKGKITYWFGDPNKFLTTRKLKDKAGQTLQDDYAEEGVFFDTMINDSHHDGHSAVRDYLYYDVEKPRGYNNNPKIYVSDDCWNINTSMLRFTWNEKKSAVSNKEVVEEKWKDFADTVRYTIIKHPIYIEDGSDGVWTPDVKGRIH